MVWENKRITKVSMKASMYMVKNMEKVNSLGMMAHIFKEHFRRVYFLVKGYWRILSKDTHIKDSFYQAKNMEKEHKKVKNKFFKVYLNLQ